MQIHVLFRDENICSEIIKEKKTPWANRDLLKGKETEGRDKSGGLKVVVMVTS
jgi:hypothetical protein